MIAVGATIRLAGDDAEWRVERRVAGGGQGDVFVLRSSSPGVLPLALKWYRDFASPRQRLHQHQTIRKVIQLGPPGPNFLWPQEFVEAADGSFGYTMRLRPDRYCGIVDLLHGKVDARPSLVLALCIELATAFLQLHAEGLCYRDVSFGNVFFDPESGAALVCDNDNVGIDGASESGVLGTGGFMAPEIVLREASPSADTDLHSLAVLIFYLTMVHHPLIGRREGELPGPEGKVEMLGSHPVFIFDPDDESNRPDPLTQPAPSARWPRYPERLQALFVQAFTEGLRNPGRRVRESVWRSALARLRDHIVVCPACGEENLTEEGAVTLCVGCRRPLASPVLLRGPNGVLVLNEGTAVTRHHLRRDYDITTVIARVVYDPGRRLWGIRNESEEEWLVEVPQRPPSSVPPGRTAAIIRGARLRMGDVEFEVVSDTED